MNRLIHGRTRLSILAFLAAAEPAKTGFNVLKDRLRLSAGNLSVQLRKLEHAGYVTIEKRFKSNRPLTTVAITSRGRNDLDGYISEMEEMIRSLKGAARRKK